MKGTIWKVIPFFLEKSKMTQCCLQSSFRTGNWNEGRRRSRQKFFFPFSTFFWKFSRSKTFPSADIGMDWRITYTYFHIFVLLHFVTFGLAALSWRLCVRQVVVCAGKSNICRNKDTCSNSFNLQKPLVIFSSGRVQGAQLWEAVCTCSPGVLLFTAPNCTCGSRTPENCASQPSSWRIFVWSWNRWNPNIGMCTYIAFKDFLFLILAW